MSFEGKNMDNKLGRFVPEVPMAADGKGGGGKNRRRRGKKPNQERRNQQQKPDQQQKPHQPQNLNKPRNINQAVHECAKEMGEQVEKTFPPESNVLHVEYSVIPLINKETGSGKLVLEIHTMAHMDDVDVPTLIKLLNTNVGNNVHLRKGENVALWVETDNMKAIVVKKGEEEKYAGQKRIVKLDPKTANERAAEAALPERLRGRGGILAKLRARWGPKPKQEYSADEEVRKIASERNQVQTDLAEAQGKNKALQASAERAQEELRKRDTEVAHLKAERARIERDLQGEMKKRVDELERKITAAEKAKAQIEQQFETAKKREATERAALEKALNENKGNLEEATRKFNAAHAELDELKTRAGENERDRNKLIGQLRAERAVQAATREQLNKNEQLLLVKSQAAEEALIIQSQLDRMTEERDRYVAANDDLRNRIAQLESGDVVDGGAVERLRGELAARDTEIEGVRALLASSEKSASALRVMQERFIVLLQKLGMDENASQEARDGALMSLRFLTAVTLDQASPHPENMENTDKLLTEFEAVVNSGSSETPES